MTINSAAMNLPSHTDKGKLTNESLFQNRKEKVKIFSPIVEEFANYLTKIGYSEGQSLKVKKYSVTRFIKHIFENEFSCFSKTPLEKFHITEYEEMLTVKVNKNLIRKHHQYKELHNVSLLSKFLYQSNLLNFTYKVPKKLKSPSGRSNKYNQKELITKLCKSILSRNTEIKFRNVAILLILVDIGCRPIELSNVKLSDINLPERQIILYCKKSGQRTLKLQPLVVTAIKKYLETRGRYKPNNDYLFLKTNGNALPSLTISSLIYAENMRAFSQSLISPNSLRHTYATNALENKIDLIDVAKAMGHEHWASTMIYLERSKKRLKDNTLKHNPFQDKWGEIIGH
ncbi:site-specific integrase [Bacillaceae bacterium IKA-2]|nr:site-specific integrase [Bacillaceae bacterium IKA-2]